jgi:hypothetical protein
MPVSFAPYGSEMLLLIIAIITLAEGIKWLRNQGRKQQSRH